jgi:hypothetical protein
MSASAENPPPVASIRPSLSVVVPQPPPPPTPRPPTPGTTTVDDGNKPVKPIMGNLVKLSKDEWVPWTGGKPNFNWTGLDTVEALGEHTSPNQLRGEYAAAAQKGYNFRRTGLATVFKKNDELSVFSKSVWNHLLDTGMDTIAYLQDPEYNDRMTDVIHGHSRFTVGSTKLLSKVQMVLYDKYDRTNDKAACSFLLSSLETTLRNRVEEKLEDSDSFTVTWLTFIKCIQSTSIDRFNSLKSRIKNRSPSQYPGENLRLLLEIFGKMLKNWRQLDSMTIY